MSVSSGSATSVTSALSMNRGWGIVNFASMGNSNEVNTVGLPALLSSVYAIGGSRTDGVRWGDGGVPGPNNGSNYGVGLAFVAPAYGNIRVASVNPTYQDHFGTSYSSPFVAGTAALMLSVNPKLDSDDVWSMLQRTARRTPGDLPNRNGEKWNPYTGWGLVNTGEAVKEAARLSPVDMVYGGFGRLITLHTGYDTRLNMQGGGLTRLNAYDSSGSQIGQVTFSDPNWRGKFIGVGALEDRVTMAREAEDGLVALDVVDPVTWQSNPGPKVSRALPKDQFWRLDNMTVGLDNDPRLLWKWEVAGTGPGWNATYYKIWRLSGWTLNTEFSTIIQPPASEFVARDIATDWDGNNYILWQSFNDGKVQIRVYNPTITAIVADSHAQPVSFLSSGATSVVSEPMPAVSLSVTTTGVCYIHFKSPQGTSEVWRWTRTTDNKWDGDPDGPLPAGPDKWRYSADMYDIASGDIVWPYSDYDSWKRMSRFKEWSKSLVVNPVDNLPRLLTTKENRSAEIWLPTYITPMTALSSFGIPYAGSRQSLPTQNFP